MDRNYRHTYASKSHLQNIINVFFKTREGNFLLMGSVFMLGLGLFPTFLEWKAIGRREYMRSEDRKVEEAIASGRE